MVAKFKVPIMDSRSFNLALVLCSSPVISWRQWLTLSIGSEVVSAMVSSVMPKNSRDWALIVFEAFRGIPYRRLRCSSVVKAARLSSIDGETTKKSSSMCRTLEVLSLACKSASKALAKRSNKMARRPKTHCQSRVHVYLSFPFETE